MGAFTPVLLTVRIVRHAYNVSNCPGFIIPLPGGMIADYTSIIYLFLRTFQ